MKSIKILTLLLGIAFAGAVFSQNADSLKTVKIKVIKEVDGVTTVIDTVFQTNNAYSDDIDLSKLVDDNNVKTTRNKDIIYVEDEIDRIIQEIELNMPTINSFKNDEGEKVYILKNKKNEEVELFRTSKNRIVFENVVINLPIIETMETDSGKTLIIRHKKTKEDDQTNEPDNREPAPKEEMKTLIKPKTK